MQLTQHETEGGHFLRGVNPTEEELCRVALHIQRFTTTWPQLSRDRAERHAKQIVLDVRMFRDVQGRWAHGRE